MVFAKELKRLVNRWVALMNESVQTLLSCRHARYGAPFEQNQQTRNNPLYKLVRIDINPTGMRGSYGIQAELQSRSRRARQDGSRSDRGKDEEEGGENCSTQSSSLRKRKSAKRIRY
jgi:hypothetical protein